MKGPIADNGGKYRSDDEDQFSFADLFRFSGVRFVDPNDQTKQNQGAYDLSHCGQHDRPRISKAFTHLKGPDLHADRCPDHDHKAACDPSELISGQCQEQLLRIIPVVNANHCRKRNKYSHRICEG